MQIKTFAALELAEPIQKSLDELGYVNPTPIQEQAIPLLLAGRDLLGCAQTGTGKTGAFALPILEMLSSTPQHYTARSAQVLVLAPTRELAQQIHDSFRAYGRHLRFRQAVIYGGVGQVPQIKACARGLDVLVATPGRLLDLMGQGHLRLDRVHTLVFDEADRMLDMGFMPDIKRVLAACTSRQQTLMFSATMPPDIARLADQMLKDPARVSVTPVSTPVERIDQKVLFVAQSDKRALLGELLRDQSASRVLIFTRTKHGANRIAKQLEQSRVAAEAIHGNKSQNARQAALNKFKSGNARVLVATDVAARGLDVEGITHVINFDLPMDPESYVHRIGRTARAGAQGVAISFCDASERGCLRGIERLIRQAVPVMTDHPYAQECPAPAPAAPHSERRQRQGQGQGQKPWGQKSGQYRPRTRSGKGRYSSSSAAA